MKPIWTEDMLYLQEAPEYSRGQIIVVIIFFNLEKLILNYFLHESWALFSLIY